MVKINQLSSIDEQSNKPKNNLSLDNAVDITQEFATGILNDNVSSNVKNAILNNSEELEGFILDYISRHQALTNGQEGEIHKIEIENKKYIVAKKRYDTKSKHEYLMHQEAYKIMLKSNSNIKVPEVLYEFQDGDNGYIVMEYIEGKTLYNLIWQEIINDHLVSIIKKHSSKGDEKSLKALEDIDDLYKRYGESGKIEFNTDREAINAMETICVIMYDLGIINGTFHQSITEPGNPIKIFPVEEELIEKYLHKIGIFNENRLNEIIKNLNIFIKEMHSNGVYHRDLGKNFRNIMFTENDTYIIDFGRTIVTNESDYNYENGLYTNDQSIVSNISKTKSKNKSEQALKIDTKQIIQKGKDLGLNINEGLIEINKDVVVKIDIISVLDDFINGNDRMYNWFIYLKYKPGSYEEKSSIQGRQKIFILLQLLNNEQKEKIEYKINEYLKERKNTKKYKYANIFNEYLNL